MTGVSLSTIERVERAEKVSDECLDRIGVALGQEPGYYTAPRRRRSDQEAAEEFREEYGELQEVQVRPLRTQVQVRELGSCHGYLINRPGLDETFDNDIGGLTEWLDLASFVLSDLSYGGDGAEGRRRELYKCVLDGVAGLETRMPAHGGIIASREAHRKVGAGNRLRSIVGALRCIRAGVDGTMSLNRGPGGARRRPCEGVPLRGPRPEVSICTYERGP